MKIGSYEFQGPSKLIIIGMVSYSCFAGVKSYFFQKKSEPKQVLVEVVKPGRDVASLKERYDVLSENEKRSIQRYMLKDVLEQKCEEASDKITGSLRFLFSRLEEQLEGVPPLTEYDNLKFLDDYFEENKKLENKGGKNEKVIQSSGFFHFGK